MKPTEEQENTVSTFKDGGNLKIIAYAGAGKTSTLRLMASSRNTRGQYLAFNKDIATEARTKFPALCNCSTTHSLAFKGMISQGKYDAEKLTSKINQIMVRDSLNLKDIVVNGKAPITLTPQTYSHLLIRVVRRFCQSSSPRILASHFKPEGLLRLIDANESSGFADQVIADSNRLWEKMTDPSDALPLGFDGYLKAWALTEPAIYGDYILLDEAQDTNEVVLDVVRKQQSQIVLVGDPYQQIYDWRGAINAMDCFKSDKTSYLTQSFRFGQCVADAANRIISIIGSNRPIRGNPAISSSISRVYADAILCRTNVGLMGNVFTAQAAGIKPYIAGGTIELKRLLKGVQLLKAGMPAHLPEFYGYRNWDEVVRDSSESDLRSLVKLVEAFGEDKLAQAVDSCVADAQSSQLTLSTGHRAKGLEWGFVRLEDDFSTVFERLLNLKIDVSSPAHAAMSLALATSQIAGLHLKMNQSPDLQAEIRLLYVALTRCQEAVQLPPLINAIFCIPPTSMSKKGVRKSAPDVADKLKVTYKGMQNILRD